jgi:hypothetical protein
MKKQILLLTFLSLAFVFAGVNKAYAQPPYDQDYLDAAVTDCPTPDPLTNCADGDHLNPIAGETYNYEISHTGNIGTGTAPVHWFVTDNPNVIADEALTTDVDAGDGTGDYILLAEAGVYDDGGQTATDIDISWKAFDGTTNQVLLVAYVLDSDGCTDNVEVWRIEPQYSFIIEIAGLFDDATIPADGDNAFECVYPVVDATYDGTNLNMDYGDNYIFFIVTAANFVESWLPSFTVDASGTSSTVGDVEWAYADEANSDATTWNDATVPVEASHWGSNSVGPGGECIVLRVLVTHGDNEIAAAAETVVVGVDGDMYNASTSTHDGTYPDLDDSANSGDPCEIGSNDNATYELTPRPDINEVSPAPASFVPKN